MKQFYEWWKNYSTDHKYTARERAVAYDAFKAGTLAAADIADRSVFPFGIRSSKDSVEYAIGNNIGARIRKAAEHGS